MAGLSCKASVPDAVHAIFKPLVDDDAATRAAGIDWAVAQSRDLIAAGAPGLHYYTLNRVEPVLRTHDRYGNRIDEVEYDDLPAGTDAGSIAPRA